MPRPRGIRSTVSRSDSRSSWARSPAVASRAEHSIPQSASAPFSCTDCSAAARSAISGCTSLGRYSAGRLPRRCSRCRREKCPRCKVQSTFSAPCTLDFGPWTLDSLEGGTIPPVVVRAAGLLVLSNVFMTFAWYAHLRNLADRPWYIAAIASWGIALFEYLLQVPANRIGYTALTLGQLKIMQEAITLIVFVPFAVLYMKQPLKLDYLWASLCIMGAVYFVFRGA